MANGATLVSTHDERYARQESWWIGVSSSPHTAVEACFRDVILTAR